LRTPKLDWSVPAFKQELLDLRKAGKSLTDVNKHLYEKYGISFTNARLSQVFSAYKKQDQGEQPVEN
jgi:hypothetical protein